VDHDRIGVRRQGGWGLVAGVLIAWVVAGVAGAFLAFLIAGSEGDPFLDPGSTLAHNAVGTLASLVVIVAAITWLRWWPVVVREDVPARRWAWVFPVGVTLGAATAADWSRIGAAGAALWASLAISVLVVATSEELAFRGFLLRAMRDRYSEFTAALITTLLFGVAHMLNGGFSNVVQGLLTFMLGYLLYVTRRVSKGILVPILIHAWWDFCVLSGDLGPGATETSSLFTAAVVELVLFVIAMAGYRLWQPRQT
jgi:membrane protease YdiL (CAAX protease family)